MTHWKAELAAAEAAEWKKLNAGWAKGLPAEVEGVKVKGKQPKAMNVAGWDGLPWWRMDGAKVGAPAPEGQEVRGYCCWPAGWERNACWKKPASEDWHGPAELDSSPAPKWEQPCRSNGCWGEPVGQPMPLPEQKPVVVEPSAAEQREAARVLRMPQRKLAPCTWVLGDANGMKKLLWAERQKQVQRQRDGEKGARALEAELGWKSSSSEAWAARRDAEGHVVVKQVSEEEMPCKPSPLEQMAAQEELAWLLKALSPRQREAMELKAEGLSRQEMAAAMGCSEKAVKKALEEGRARAKKLV